MILPKIDKHGKPYLSYSQINSFLYNKKDYIKSYFFNEPIQFTAYIDFGSKVGKALETNDFSDFSEEEQQTLKRVPRLDEFEKEIRVDFGEFYLKGFIDTNSSDLTHFMDYKTGAAKKVTEYQKDDYIQPHIYALGIEQETGILPKKADIILIERYGNAFKGEPLTVGKEILPVPIDISRERIEYARELVIKTAKEIEHYYKIFLKLNK